MVFIFLVMLMPDSIYWEYAFFKIDEPSFIDYHLFSTNINFIDIILILIGTTLTIKSRKIIVAQEMLAIAILSSWGICILVIQGINLSTYNDGIIYGARIILTINITAILLKLNKGVELVNTLILAIVVLVIISLVSYYIFGYTNKEGRLNALGLGPNTASELVGSALIFLIFLMINKKQTLAKVLIAIPIVLCINFILLSGSRKSLLIAAFIVLSIYLTETKLNKKKVFIVTFLYFLLALIFFYQGDILEYIKEFTANSNIPLLIRTNELIEKAFTKGEVIDGRENMYTYVYEIIHLNPFWGIGASNWRLQELLAPFGISTGSHSHSVFLQMYTKYGILSILFIFYIGYKIVKAFSLHSPISMIMTFLLINQTFDYGGWNQKYLFFVTTIYMVHTYSNAHFRKTLYK